MTPQIFSCSLILVLASALGFARSSGKIAAQTGSAAVAAASAAAPVPAIPKDPTKLMLLAAQLNGLSSMGTHPWHVKANFQTFDADGKPKDQGVFEEWWAGPEKYKMSYVSNGFNQVEYRNGNKDLVTGDTNLPPDEEQMAMRLLLSPMPSNDEIGNDKYAGNDAKVGPVKMKCLHVDAPPQTTPLFTYCLDTLIPAIRIKAEYADFTTYFNSIISVDGHYVAKQIRAQRIGKPYLNEDVMFLAFPQKLDDAEFVAPASAAPAAGPPPKIKAEMLMGNRISGKDPKYPQEAKDARIQGTVLLDARITKDGIISGLHVASGPPMLRQSALDAVYTWRYHPYLLNGKPAEVETTITVVYILGR